MTDKEIIIDGVNVTGCEYMLNNKIKGKQHCPAKAMPYAKETSCICRKSIDTPYNFCKHNPNCHYKQLKRLEQENAELKAENEQLQALCDMYKTFYRAKHDDIKGILFKYRQTLREIKTIAEDRTKTEDYLLGQEYTDLVDKIIDIITKAESEG